MLNLHCNNNDKKKKHKKNNNNKKNQKKKKKKSKSTKLSTTLWRPLQFTAKNNQYMLKL